MYSAALPSTVVSRTTGTPPASPSNTAKYIIPASGATGAWASSPNRITWYENGAWAFATPSAGFELFVSDEKVPYTWDGTTWDTPTTTFAPLASPALTGTPTAPTAALNTNTSQLATTAFVIGQDAFLAPLANPTFTGTVTAPTFSGSGSGLSLGSIAESYTIQNLGTLSAQQTLAPSLGRYMKMTLGANTSVCINNGSSTSATEKIQLEITQDATGSRLITWQSQHGFIAGNPPTLSTTPGAIDLLEFTWSGVAWILTNSYIGIVLASSIVYGLRPSVSTVITNTRSNPTLLQNAYDSGLSTVVDSTTAASLQGASVGGGNDAYLTVNYSGFAAGPSKSGNLVVAASNSGQGSSAIYSQDGGTTWLPLATFPGSFPYTKYSVPLTNVNPANLQVRFSANAGGGGGTNLQVYDIVFI